MSSTEKVFIVIVLISEIGPAWGVDYGPAQHHVQQHRAAGEIQHLQKNLSQQFSQMWIKLADAKSTTS